MTGRHETLRCHPDPVAIVRLAPEAEVPGWAVGPFSSITRTEAELSIVCSDARVPAGYPAERGWRRLEVRGPLAFSEVGVLSALVGPLAERRISVFCVSTYDTDFVLVRDVDLHPAIETLRQAGHAVDE